MTVSRSVDLARKRICHLARDLGYVVTREESDGVVTIALLWLGANPHVRLIEVLPSGHPEDPWVLGERVVASGVAIPQRVTPGEEVRHLLDLLVEVERTTSEHHLG